MQGKLIQLWHNNHHGILLYSTDSPFSTEKTQVIQYLLPTKVRISVRRIFFHKMDDRLLLSLAKMASLHSQLSTVQEDPSSSSSWFYYHVWHIHIQNKQKPWSINSIRKKVALSKCYIKLLTLISSLFARHLCKNVCLYTVNSPECAFWLWLSQLVLLQKRSKREQGNDHMLYLPGQTMDLGSGETENMY